MNNGGVYDSPVFSHYPLLGEHPGNSTHELLLKFMLLKEMSTYYFLKLFPWNYPFHIS